MQEPKLNDQRIQEGSAQNNFLQLLSFVPGPPHWRIDWKGIEETELQLIFRNMAETMQNPRWHGEGDVWTHTKMVCEELTAMEKFRRLDERRRQEAFLAALLHDIGKIPCTVLDAGTWTSPHHTSVGARMAREILWNIYGLSGTEEKRNFRETICNIIRYHSIPPHILDQSVPERRLLKIAANGELASDFTIELLCLVEEADMRGRIGTGKDASLELIQLCAEMAEEAGCFAQPVSFTSDYEKHAYFSGKTNYPGVEMYDDTWGEIVLMSGLPGTGKDTWIRKHLGDLPVVSLDEVRRHLGISPREEQGPVISAAREQAKGYLRKKQPFVWNATNVTPMIRRKQLQLFENYQASSRIVFLETEWEEGLARNRSRKEEVPEQAIGRMLRNLVLPERAEAQRVEWYCV